LSAVLGIAAETLVQRDTNHADLCRCRDEEDFEYIWLHIRRLSQDAQKMYMPTEVKPLSPPGMLATIQDKATLLLLH
jgi:hypothetical protein